MVQASSFFGSGGQTLFDVLGCLFVFCCCCFVLFCFFCFCFFFFCNSLCACAGCGAPTAAKLFPSHIPPLDCASEIWSRQRLLAGTHGAHCTPACECLSFVCCWGRVRASVCQVSAVALDSCVCCCVFCCWDRCDRSDLQQRKRLMTSQQKAGSTRPCPSTAGFPSSNQVRLPSSPPLSLSRPL